MKDAQGDSAYGRTNWRRFAVAVGVPAVVATGIVLGVANGALAANFAVSGQEFKISADTLVGTGFAQYGYTDYTADGVPLPVAVSGIHEAKLYNLCQSVVVPVAPISLTIRAGRGANNPATAEDLLIGVTRLSGDATFHNINIGADAHSLTKGGSEAKGIKGWFGQEADDVTITGLQQTAYSTSAGTFRLTGLDLKVNLPGKDGKAVECY
ncbi:MAG: hypothetical protein QOE51_1022 [Actinoplanes sp.]|nr:hypothetical protein [Actinoplanes sp.]